MPRALAQQGVKLINSPRLMAHLGLMVVVTAVVLVGGINAVKQEGPTVANNASTLVAETGYGGVVDVTASAYIAADVAQQLELPVAEQVSQQVQSLSTQVTAETAGSQYLAKPAVITASASNKPIQSYMVKEGDTMGAVAQQFGITAETLAWANDLTLGSKLIPGTQLRVLPLNGVVHVLAPNDTPEKLAAYYGADAGQIISYNDLETGLTAGKEIVIPEGKKPQAASTKLFVAAAVPIFNSNGNTYSYGYCTWYAKNRRPDIPNQLGNAISWYSGAQRAGLAVGTAPRVGAVAWEKSNHVAYVEAVNADGSVTVSEMNYAGWGRVSTRTVSASAFNYIY